MSNTTKQAKGITNAFDRQIGGVHYLAFKIQPMEFGELNKLSPCEYNVVKRICRWRRGGKGIEDLQKARHELELLIEIQLKKEQRGE